MTTRAASDLSCPPKQVSTWEVEEGRYRAEGCGRAATYFCTMDTKGREVCDLERPSAAAEVQKQVEKDTKCPAHTVQVDAVDGAFAVKGCGRKALYRCSARGQGFSCERDRGPGVTDDGEKPKTP